MLVHWEEKIFDYDPRMIDTRTAIRINEYTGLGLRSWEKAVDDGNAKALQALLFAIKVQAGERVTSPSALTFSVLDFYDAIVQAAAEELAEKIAAEPEPEADDAVDPTLMAETIRAGMSQ